jgi:hypothetical protein
MKTLFRVDTHRCEAKHVKPSLARTVAAIANRRYEEPNIMQTRPMRHALLSGLAVLAVVTTSMLANAATQSSVGTAAQPSATSGTSTTLQTSARSLVGTATTATTSASFRGVGAAFADASRSER